MNVYGAAAANNSLSSPQFVMKLSMVTFLFVQAIRQLVLVNGQYDDKKETRSGQVAAWMTITLTVLVAGFLYATPIADKKIITGGLTLLFAGVMGSGIAMVYSPYEKVKEGEESRKTAEPKRMWFAIAHIIFAVMLLAFLIYSLVQ